jgi:hypothetical protein
VHSGPMQGEYNTSDATTDAFVKTSHLLSNVRGTLKEKLKVSTDLVGPQRNDKWCHKKTRGSSCPEAV